MPYSRSPTPPNRGRSHRSTRKRSHERSSERRHKSSRSSHKEKRRDRSRSASRPRNSAAAADSARIYAPSDVALELGGGNVNMARLDKKTVDWLQSKINEQSLNP
uniref:Arginine and glutamate-rich protein 1 n=1 Tax=Globodera rostochiensis TaxID=31243 RepID=A0A914HBD3_GLORO